MSGTREGPHQGVAPAPEPHQLLELARHVAHSAGDIAARGQQQVRVFDTKSSPTDVVTEMDRATERHVREQLLKARPADALLGEEVGASAGSSGVRWIIDPIDGTVNYLYGRADWAVSIAAEYGGSVLAGVVTAPVLGVTYSAVRGGGAMAGQRPLRRIEVPALELALLATGFGYDAARRAEQAEILRSVLPRVRDIRRAGSSALDLCAVASGEVDGYYEHGLSPWDWSAAALVAAESGVRVAEPGADELLVAAPEPLFASLAELVSGRGPRR